MEERAVYSGDSVVEIRPETLKPAKVWEQASPDEVKAIIQLTGLNGGEVAAILGLTPQSNKSGRGSRTVRRWTSGDTPIPYAAWALLAYVAGFGPIWEG